MKLDDFITARQAEEAEKAAAKQRLIEDEKLRLLPEFERAVRGWLGQFHEQLTKGVLATLTFRDKQNTIVLRQSIFYSVDGAEQVGCITQHWHLNRSTESGGERAEGFRPTKGDTVLAFGFDLRLTPMFREDVRDGRFVIEAEEIELDEWFHLLTKVRATVQGERAQAEKRERQRIDDLRRHYLVCLETPMDDGQLDNTLNEALAEFPDEKERLSAAWQTGKARLDARAAALKEAQAREAEDARLQKEVAKEWEETRGSYVYLITYGYASGDLALAAGQFYSPTPSPDSDGFYLAYAYGKPTRRIKPESVVSTEAIHVPDLEAATEGPECRRWAGAVSSQYPDLVHYAYFPPSQAHRPE